MSSLEQAARTVIFLVMLLPCTLVHAGPDAPREAQADVGVGTSEATKGVTPTEETDLPAAPDESDITKPTAPNAQPNTPAQPLFLGIQSTKGTIQCELDVKGAPDAIGHFRQMIEQERYQDSSFCRVVPSYFIQGGCPDQRKRSQKEPSVKLDPKGQHAKPGTLSLVSNKEGVFGQQFIILERAAPWLNGVYVAIGLCRPLKTIKALARVPTVAKASPRRPIGIIGMRLGSESDTKPVNGLAK